MFKIEKENVPTIIIVFSIFIAIISFYFIPFAGGDNFAYFYLSRAIVQGKGYVELWNQHQPLHTQYPPIFPLLLLPAAIFNSYIFAKIIVFFCYVFLLIFSYRLFRELNKSESENATLVSLLFLSSAPVLIEYSSWVLSEIPYMLISVLALYFWSKKKYNISLLFASLAFLTRTAGITLLISIIIFYLLKFKNDKKKLIFPLLGLLSSVSWFFYGFLNKDPLQKTYLQTLLMKDPYKTALGNINILDLVIRLGQNIREMITKVFTQIFWTKSTDPFAYISSEIKVVPLFLGIIIFILVFWGIFGDTIFTGRIGKKENEKHSENSNVNLIKLYTILYFLTIWSWPVIWAAEKRFYLPILPLIVFWMGRGIMNCLKLFPESYRKDFFCFIIPGILAANFIFMSLISAPTLWRNNIKWNTDRIYPYGINFFNPYINFKKWAVRKGIPENSVFIAEKRRIFYHLTNFYAVKNPKSIAPEDLGNIIDTDRVDYIVIVNHSSYKITIFEGMKRLIDKYDFVPVYFDPGETISVIRCYRKDIISGNRESEGYFNKFLRDLTIEN